MSVYLPYSVFFNSNCIKFVIDALHIALIVCILTLYTVGATNVDSPLTIACTNDDLVKYIRITL